VVLSLSLDRAGYGGGALGRAPHLKSLLIALAVTTALAAPANAATVTGGYDWGEPDPVHP